jgi:hypothetical protein
MPGLLDNKSGRRCYLLLNKRWLLLPSFLSNEPGTKQFHGMQGPKRCTTTLVERNLTSLPGDGICSWASCEEWCLSQVHFIPCSAHGHHVRNGASHRYTLYLCSAHGHHVRIGASHRYTFYLVLLMGIV